MFDWPNLIRDSLITSVLAICAERIVNKIKNWYYSERDIKINDVHIDFIPQTTEEETMIITERNHNPKIFKFYSNVK